MYHEAGYKRDKIATRSLYRIATAIIQRDVENFSSGARRNFQDPLPRMMKNRAPASTFDRYQTVGRAIIRRVEETGKRCILAN